MVESSTGFARKLPRRQAELNVLPRCILATNRKRKNLLFFVRQKSEKLLGKYNIITEKLFQNHHNIFDKKFAGINKLTAAFEI
jgi:hypothetical protein